MACNPINQPLEDQFLGWCQDMEMKQEEKAKHMAELQDHDDLLKQETNHLRAHLEEDQG